MLGFAAKKSQEGELMRASAFLTFLRPNFFLVRLDLFPSRLTALGLRGCERRFWSIPFALSEVEVIPYITYVSRYDISGPHLSNSQLEHLMA